jgi:hypothetical protein
VVQDTHRGGLSHHSASRAKREVVIQKALLFAVKLQCGAGLSIPNGLPAGDQSEACGHGSRCMLRLHGSGVSRRLGTKPFC